MKSIFKIIFLVLLIVVGSATLWAQAPFWKWANSEGGTGYDRGGAIYVTADSNLMVAGYFAGTAYFGGDTLTTPAGFGMFLAEYDRSGSLLWVKRVATCTAMIDPKDIYQDPTGDIYVTGHYGSYPGGGTVTFLPSSTYTSAGLTDFFVAKFTASGTLLWARSIYGAEESNTYYTSAMTPSGEIIVAGTYFTEVRFSDSFDTLPGESMYDLFLARYTASGSLAAATKVAGDPGVLYPQGLVTDDAGNVYIGGKYTLTPYFGIYPDTTYLPLPWGENGFLVIFTPALEKRWVYAGIGTTLASNLMLESDGASVFVLGEYADTLRLHSFAPTVTLTSAGFLENFLARFDSTGSLLWAKNAGHSPSAAIHFHAHSFSATQGLYFAGDYNGYATFGEGPAAETMTIMDQAFAVKYGLSGDLDFVARAGSAWSQSGYGIQSDNWGNVYVTGFYNLACDFDTSTTGFLHLAARGADDVFVARLGAFGDVGTGMADPAEMGIRAFPLPATNEVTIRFQSGFADVNALDIVNAVGQVVGPLVAPRIQGDVAVLDVRDLPEGLYFVRYQGKYAHGSVKILLAR